MRFIASRHNARGIELNDKGDTPAAIAACSSSVSTTGSNHCGTTRKRSSSMLLTRQGGGTLALQPPLSDVGTERA